MRYCSPTTAMHHQLEYLKKAASKPPVPSSEDVFAALCEQGTGKSKMILDEWGEGAVHGGTLDLLIVAPSGSIRNWYEDKTELQRSEIKTHLDPDLMERTLVAPWITGGGTSEEKTRLRRMMECEDSARARILLVNVEALSTVDAAQELCKEFLCQRLATMVVDESTKIKSYKSKRTKAVVKLGGEAVARRILTGLVAPRSPLDLFSQFEFLDWRILGQKNYFSFKRRYAKMEKAFFGGKVFDKIVGYQNIEELTALIEPYSYRALKKDCLDLAPKTYTVREVNQTPEQIRYYKELKQNATTQLSSGEHVSAQLVITQMMRMHTINLGFVRDEVGEIHEVPERRTAALLDVLEEHEGKVIVWAPFDFSIRRIVGELKKEYGENSVAAFWGGNKNVRGEEERRFLGDPECRFMVSTPAAGGWGNTWTVATLVVYYGNNYDLEQRAQSEDRAHRKGQRNPVTYVDLVARGTVDEKIVKALREKIDLVTLITGEGYRPWLV